MNKPSNLSSGTLATVKLAKYMLNLDKVYSLDSRYVLCFNGHSYSCSLGNNIWYVHRPLGKRSLNSLIPDWSLKNTQVIELKLESQIINLNLLYRKKKKYSMQLVWEGKCTRFPSLSKEECILPILIVEFKNFWFE